MAEKSKSPEIRFKGFSEEWEERKLGENSEIVAGGTPSTAIAKYWEPKQIPWMSSGEVNKKRLFETDNQISEVGFHNSSAKFIRENSVLIALAGQGKTRGTVAINCIPLTTNQSIAAIIPCEKIHFEFLFQNLEKRYEELRMQSSGDGTRGGLNKQIISEIIIPCPKVDEQIKIGDFSQQLDNLITLRQRKLDKLGTIKKAMLEKMFPKNGALVPEIRFKGFTENWKEKDLSDEVEFYSGLTYSPTNVIKNGGTLVLRSSNVKNSEIVYGDNVYVDSNVVNCDNVKVGDIIIVVRNGSRSLIGKHAQIKENMNSTVIGAFMTGIHSNQSAFINALLDTSKFDKEVEKNLGATINQITNGAFKKMQFKFPDSNEQLKIGAFFQQLDNLITLQNRELEKQKNIKKACLEKMFV